MPFDLDIAESLAYKMGEAKGEAKSLTLMLEKLFGPIPDSTREQIARASNDELETWIVRTVRAQSLAEVFAS